jgi:DNA-binding transcriptional regulator YiaG
MNTPALTDWTPEAIRALRERYGETQLVFSRRLRMTTFGIRAWEQGKNKPSGGAAAMLDRLLEDADHDQIRPHPDTANLE